MAGLHKQKRARRAGSGLTVSHRERLVDELRADPDLAMQYLNAAAEDDDPRVYLAALRTVAEAHGIAKVAKAAGFRIAVQRA